MSAATKIKSSRLLHSSDRSGQARADKQNQMLLQQWPSSSQIWIPEIEDTDCNAWDWGLSTTNKCSHMLRSDGGGWYLWQHKVVRTLSIEINDIDLAIGVDSVGLSSCCNARSKHYISKPLFPYLYYRPCYSGGKRILSYGWRNPKSKKSFRPSFKFLRLIW